MSIYSDISKLTLDPGARALAQLMDELKDQVDNCCGGDLTVAEDKNPAANPDPAVKTAGNDTPAAKPEPATGAGASGRGTRKPKR